MKAYLEPNEIEKLVSAVNCLRDKILILLLFYLGCRISEALGIEVKDINFETGTIMIQHLKSRIKLTCITCGARLGKGHSFCPKCGLAVKDAVTKEQEHRKMRTLPVGREIMKLLEDYIKGGGPVSRNGKPVLFNINRHRAWQIIRDAARRANLPKLVNPETGKIHGVSPHKLRDAFAVNAMKLDNTGDGLRMLQQYLGHANFNTTAKYRKVSGDEQREWYQKLWKNNKVEPKDEET